MDEKNQGQKPPIWRRQYYINPEFQGTFVQMVIGTALLINFILYGANIYIFFKFNEYGETLNYEQKKQFYEFFQTQIVSLNKTFLVCGSIIFGVLLIYGVLMSHKVAGPVFNLKKKLKQLQDLQSIDDIQSIQETQFRESDFFREMADEYNNALKNIQQLRWKERKKEPAGVHDDNKQKPSDEPPPDNVIEIKKIA